MMDNHPEVPIGINDQTPYFSLHTSSQQMKQSQQQSMDFQNDASHLLQENINNFQNDGPLLLQEIEETTEPDIGPEKRSYEEVFHA